MRITSDGRLGIGTTSPATKLVLSGNSNTSINETTFRILDTYTLLSGDEVISNIETYTSDGDGAHIATFIKTIAGLYGLSNIMTFGVSRGSSANAIEAMRIDSSGNLLVGKTSTSGSVAGSVIYADGVMDIVRDGHLLMVNRLTSDGDLIRFQQGSVQEGTISVSGATVSYNGFTGSHWSRFIDESKPDVLRGTVMESLDQMTDWYNAEFETSYTEKDVDGNDVVKTVTNKKPYALKANEQEGDVITYSWNTEKKDEEGNDIIEQVQATIVKQVDVKHVMSKISDTVEAKNVYGVFSAWDNDDLINNDFYVASVGSYVVRIKAGQTVSKGDLLQSNGDGTAKVQADDIIRASTFAKVLSNTVIDTYEDGSFIVPCSLMC